ncbi:OprO/OprP family phosphate-selective porin [Thalassotalea sp. PS06]|uniref:OprO/OprP family phosphate-selective porin n=1 Tax=Thalassotalea sp. PS06 TaxID=2594005 RepID=UPI001C8F9702|nr:OprO/OprP family phosphate-selective porin [Thalassotalea sp. PS06]
MNKLCGVCVVGGILLLPVSDSKAEADTSSFTLGGALRGNYSWLDYSTDSNGSFDFDLFRLDLKAEKNQWFVDVQYRWYKAFDAIHHAELGYQFSDQQSIRAGVTQVPFGIEPYASHSFWFGGTYYLGFEDDYDTGIKWRFVGERWTLDTAYFVHSEYNDADRWDRYSFDLANSSKDGIGFEEDGQFNIRGQYQLGVHLIGTSVQIGRFNNTSTNESGEHRAIAFHIDSRFEHDWNLQLQYINYDYEAEEALGTDNKRITMAAFEAPFEIATRADVISVNLAKSFTVNNRFIDSFTCYNDHTYIAPTSGAGLTDSIQNVTGCSFVKGGLYTYVDWIAGKNMWFVGGPGIGMTKACQNGVRD